MSDIDVYDDDDMFDESKTTDEEFLRYLDKKYEPAPVEPPPAPSALQPTAPLTSSSTKTKLAELQTQVSKIDEQIQAVGGPAVELQAARLAITEQVERLSDAVTYGFDGKPDDDLETLREDAVLQLEEIQKTITTLPAESMRSAADRVRLARAERERDELLAKEVALSKEKALRRDLEAFGRVRTEGIDSRARKAIEAERAKALNDRLAKAKSEPDFQGWMVQAITHEMTSIPITPDDLAAKRAEIQEAFDRQIADGIRRENIRKVGGDPDARWSGYDQAR